MRRIIGSILRVSNFILYTYFIYIHILNQSISNSFYDIYLYSVSISLSSLYEIVHTALVFVSTHILQFDSFSNTQQG